MKKKLKVIIILAAIVFVIAAVVSVFVLKPDWRFIAADYCSRVFNADKAELTDIIPQTVGYTSDELKADDRIIFNQSAMLINSEHTLTEGFEAEVAPYKDTEVLMNTCIADAYARIVSDIYDKFGNKLYIMSAYRNADEQTEIDKQEGDSAVPASQSEHVAGLALDVYVMYFAGYGFIKSDVGQFVNSECWKYGFIIRYPYYGENETGVGYEPWHIRYVGEPHAQFIYENGLTYEEYIVSLEIGKFYSLGEYTISRQSGDTLYLPENFRSAVVSADNTGSYLITCK